MLNHHPTVSDRGSQSRTRINSRVSGASSKRNVQLKTAMCNQLRQNFMTASLLERRRMCSGIVAPSPLYSSQIPLPHTLPGVYDARSLVAGGYSWQYPVTTPAMIGLNDVVMTTRSDVSAPASMATRARTDVTTPLSTYFRGSVNDASSKNRCAKWFSEAHDSSVTSLTTTAVTPSNSTTTPRHVADSGISSRHRRPRATPDSVGRTRARLRQSRRSFLYAADASDDSSSTTSEDQRAVSSSLPVIGDASTKQPQYGEVTDTVSLPTSDSAYSDADEVPDVERQ